MSFKNEWDIYLAKKKKMNEIFEFQFLTKWLGRRLWQSNDCFTPDFQPYVQALLGISMEISQSVMKTKVLYRNWYFIKYSCTSGLTPWVQVHEVPLYSLNNHCVVTFIINYYCSCAWKQLCKDFRLMFL